MAPEQARGDSSTVGPAADVYALGVILYELLTGVIPFSGPPMVLLFNTVHTPPIPPRQRNPAVDATLDTICLQALQKEPAARFSSMAAFAKALQEAARTAPTTEAAQPVAPANPIFAMPTQMGQAPAETLPPEKGRAEPPSVGPDLPPAARKPGKGALPREMDSAEERAYQLLLGEAEANRTHMPQAAVETLRPPILPPGSPTSPASCPALRTSGMETMPHERDDTDAKKKAATPTRKKKDKGNAKATLNWVTPDLIIAVSVLLFLVGGFVLYFMLHPSRPGEPSPPAAKQPEPVSLGMEFVRLPKGLFYMGLG
jgi:serine/threonine protein kinase